MSAAAEGRALYVDADACPVKAEAEQAAMRHRMPVVLVCNGGIRPSANPLVRVVYVAEGLDAADRWIAERAGPGDVVVTADIPLAAACVAAGAQVLTHAGEALTPRNIGAAVAARNLMTDLRAADPLGRTTGGGARPFGRADRARFSQALDLALRQAVRAGRGGRAAGQEPGVEDTPT